MSKTTSDPTSIVEQMSTYEVIDHLLVWKNTYKDQSNNFDARLLQRAADLLEELQEKANDHEDCADSLTVAYMMGAENMRDRMRKESGNGL